MAAIIIIIIITLIIITMIIINILTYKYPLEKSMV